MLNFAYTLKRRISIFPPMKLQRLKKVFHQGMFLSRAQKCCLWVTNAIFIFSDSGWGFHSHCSSPWQKSIVVKLAHKVGKKEDASLICFRLVLLRMCTTYLNITFLCILECCHPIKSLDTKKPTRSCEQRRLCFVYQHLVHVPNTLIYVFRCE